LRVTLSRAARRERRRIWSQYRHDSPAAAHNFRERLREALRYIAEYPEGAPIIAFGLRGKTLRTFPFTVIYAIEARMIYVLTIADQRRDPESLHPFSN